LNAKIQERDAHDDRRRIAGKLTTVGQDFAVEKALLAPLPTDRFEPGLPLSPRVDHSALITVRQAKYSVPVRLVGKRVRAILRASEVLVLRRPTPRRQTCARRDP